MLLVQVCAHPPLFIKHSLTSGKNYQVMVSRVDISHIGDWRDVHFRQIVYNTVLSRNKVSMYRLKSLPFLDTRTR